MKTLYLYLVGSLVWFSCTKEPDKVPDIKFPNCEGRATYVKDSILTEVSKFDNTVFLDDSSNVVSKCYRLDARLYENSGRFFQLILKDFTDFETINPGFYDSTSTIRNGKLYHYNTDYTKSNYQLDSTSIRLTGFDNLSMTFSANFSTRMIDSVKKDTIRIRQGIIENLCFKERNQ